MANIGKNIKLFRTGKNMTQEAFAEQLFVSRQTVSNYENNKSNPDIDMLMKMAEVLETDVNTLIYGEPEQKEKKKKVVNLLIQIVVVVLAGIGIFYLKQVFYDMKEFKYDITGMLLYYTLIFPVYLIMAGWTLIGVIFQVFKVQPLKKNRYRWMKWSVVGILICYFLLILPTCVETVVNEIRFQIMKQQWDVSMNVNFVPLWMYQLFSWTFFPFLKNGGVWTFFCIGMLLKISYHVVKD